LKLPASVAKVLNYNPTFLVSSVSVLVANIQAVGNKPAFFYDGPN
jgi:hypothetical protein